MLNRFARKKLCGLTSLLLFSLVSGQINAQTSPIATGIEGVISIGPTHGGPIRDGESASVPLANFAFVVAGAAGEVATFTTDASGHFRIPLAPGRYSIKVKEPRARFPRCGPFDVEVTATGFNKVTWDCDTGMR
ncbi:MAG: carboxypeptidase-like regulatory domain-containing protein [Verrucomicrobiota bacterium]|nr:carboxypeptidase-like regulatory domain-containing protein [Verrucomicrobiota bacterium]